MERLQSFVGGRWVDGGGDPVVLTNPATEEPVAEVRNGFDAQAALTHARAAGALLRKLTFAERGALLQEMSRVLHAPAHAPAPPPLGSHAEKSAPPPPSVGFGDPPPPPLLSLVPSSFFPPHAANTNTITIQRFIVCSMPRNASRARRTTPFASRRKRMTRSGC